MVGITEISAIVAAAGVLAGVAYYILDMRNQSKMRRTDVLMRLHLYSGSREMVEARHTLRDTDFRSYEDFVEKYGSPLSKTPVGIAFGMIGSFYEGIGILVHRKLADVGLVYELFPAQSTWKKMEPIVKGLRKQYADPAVMEWFEYLCNEFQKYEQELQQSKT